MKPILFTIGDFSLRSYGVIVALAILLGLGVAYSLASNEKDYRKYLLDVVVYAVIGSIIGGRFWQVFFFEWDYYSKNLIEIPMIWHGGLSILGALVGAFITTWVYSRRHGIDFWRLVDVAAPGIIFGQAVGRIACFLNGDAFGTPTNSGFGIVYPPGTPAFETFGNQPLWPAEIWESQLGFIIFAVILMMSRWKKWSKGIVFLSYIVLYSIGRFSLEFLRGDSSRFLFNWTAGQWSSAGMAVIALVLGVVLTVRGLHKQGH